MSWTWIDPAVVLAIHDQQLAEHGGMSGVRDMALLESTLARPPQHEACDDPDVFDLAAAYAHGIARNHPFVDGNKRTAYVVCMLFPRLHGFRVKAPAPDRVILFDRLGKGEVQQEDLAAWLREHGILLER
ncbi:MAG: type II toxin-antitoxin system death-on-curing family toxin [Syntrophobacteraceae bacterium]|jgi:death-on-curing protein|nr:type II toxin-antitoxin system death-on-curing family toxin [Syntrophobacteraceae bacterium]